ncbi:MAG TPA: hypothetical protein VEJ84_05745, partial [Acidimicrobiales bacterium]|nr:hypothetical protein [Acidimicrobiales bacterium]
MAIVASGLVFAQAAQANPTAAQIANCVANVGGVAVPASLKRSYCSEVIGDLSLVGPRLGLPVIPLISKPRANGFSLDFSATPDPSDPDADAATGFYGASPCSIVIYPRLWKSTASTRVHLSLLHEVVHCYQGVVWGSQEAVADAPPFIREGSATYLAVVAAGYSSAPGAPSQWLSWFNPSGPQPSLLTRSYDAMGWYALLAQVRGSLWGVMVRAWRAYQSGGRDAFIETLGGDTTAVEQEWGPALVNNSLWGSPWVAQGVGIPHGAYADGTSGESAGSLPVWSGLVDYDPPTGKMLLLVHVTNGYAAVHDLYGNQAVGFTDQLFCQDRTAYHCGYKPVTCDNGTNITVDKLYGRYTLAVSSDASPASFTVGEYSDVNDIPSDISPCDAGVPMEVLMYYGNHPCLLLFDTDSNSNTTTVSGQVVWSEAATSPLGGLCSWGTQTKQGIIPVGGQIAIQKEPWTQVESMRFSTAKDVGGLGEEAFCNPGASTGYTPGLFVELNSDWYLGATGAPPGGTTGTCPGLAGVLREA